MLEEQMSKVQQGGENYGRYDTVEEIHVHLSDFSKLWHKLKDLFYALIDQDQV